MSDAPITVPQSDRQSAVDAVVDAIQTNRGGPAAVTAVQRTPAMSYNTARPDEIVYHSDEDRRLAEQAVESQDTLDDRDPAHEFKTLIDRVTAENAKLEEHTFDPQTGAKVYVLAEGSEARRVQQARVQQLCLDAEYQEGVYKRALDARAVRDAAVLRGGDAAAIAVAFTNGDPRRQALLDKALEEAEARHVAEAMIRARLGNLGS